mgnify:CR=1 FL=1
MNVLCSLNLENLKKESDYIYRVNAFTAINQNKLGHSQAWKFKPKKIYNRN